MGGRNHQPCNKYLENSTRLSRSVSQANLMLEHSNIALEDVILAELRGDKSTMRTVQHYLLASGDYVRQALADITALANQMNVLGYTDLPEINDPRVSYEGGELSDRGIVLCRSWVKMYDLWREKTFYGVLDYFTTALLEIERDTMTLAKKISGLQDHAEDGKIHTILESNMDGNFKVEFAKLYTSWNTFLSDFMASSLISTTIWYLNETVGTLLNPKTKVSVQ